MKKTLFLLFSILTFYSYSQRAKVQVVEFVEVTSTQRDNYTPSSGTYPLIRNTTTSQYEYWDGDSWEEAKFYTLTQEEVEDYFGASISGNTETLITVSYDDLDGTLDFIVDNDLNNYDNSTSGFISSVSESDVTQHQSALVVTESQISDLQSYLTSVSELDVTQHESALNITESQISDLQSYLLSSNIDTFSELDALVSDKSLFNTSDNLTISGETTRTSSLFFTAGNLDIGGGNTYIGVDNGVSGRRWLLDKNPSSSDLIFGYQQANGTDSSGAFSSMGAIAYDGSITEDFHLVTKSYYENNLLSTALEISYDNTTSGLTASNVKAAIDELSASSDSNDFVTSATLDVSNVLTLNIPNQTNPTVDLSGLSGGGSGTNYQGVSSPVQMTANHDGTTSNQVDDSGELKWIHHYVSSSDDFSVTLDNQHPLGETFTYSVLSDGSQITIKPSSGSVNVKIKGTNEGSTNNQLVASTHGDLIHFTRYANNQYIVWGDGTASDADLTAPTVVSATVEDADPDSLVVVFSEAVNVTNLTDLSLNGSWTGVSFSSIVSGSGTTTVTFDLDTDIAGGESGSFVYGASNTVSDLAGNSLASSSTAVTNDVSSCTPLATTYYDEADAASDFYCNEANAVSSYWTTSNASIAAVQVGSEEGIYALEFTQSGAGAAYVEYNIPGTETNGQVFDVELRLQEVTNINGVISQWQNVSGDTPTSVTLSTTITTYTYSPTATGDGVKIRIYINGTGGSSGDKVRLYWMKLTAG